MASTPYKTTGTVGLSNLQFLNFNYDLADISAADILTDFVIPVGFKLLRMDATVTKAASTASKAATLTAKIAGTTVSGASLALTSANCTPLGKVLSATPTDVLFGGNNQGAAGGKLSVAASSVTAFVEGAITLTLVLQSLD
jgi:hypothetical protein